MPDRGSPGSRWYIAAELVAAVAGLVGMLLAPSPSVIAALSDAGVSWAVALWSAAFFAAGAAAACARLRRWYYAETVAVDVLGGVFLLWAAMVAVAASPTAIQAGLGFVVAALFMHGWASWRRYRLTNTIRSFHVIATEVARQEAEAQARTDEDAG